MAAVWCVAVLTIVSAPLSRAADTAKEKLQEGEEPQPAPETDFQAEVSMSITLVNVLWQRWRLWPIGHPVRTWQTANPRLEALQVKTGSDPTHVAALLQD